MADSILNQADCKAPLSYDNLSYEREGKAVYGILGDVMLVDSSGKEVGVAKSGVAVNGYIGKAANGDFTAVYLAETTIQCSNLPGEVISLQDEDIEMVRQINTSGDVVAIYTKENTRITVAGNVITVTGATFAASDTFVVFTNIPKAVSAGGGGVGGGNNTYTNANNTDFTATPTVGATTVTIAGLPFVLEEGNIILGSIKKKAATSNNVTTLNPMSVSVAGGVITFGGIPNFVAGDSVYITLIGPDKSYDNIQDNQLVAVQNPNYAHTTSVEILVDETNLLGYKGGPGEAGSDTDTLVMAAGAFSESTHALGYKAYQTTDAQTATLNSVSGATQVETSTLSGAATWLGKNYSLPQVKRYEINMDTYNFLTIHYRLKALTFCNAYFQIWGTLDSAATVDSDTGWVNLSGSLLGNSDGVLVPMGTAASDTREDIVVIDTPTTMLKYMIKIVVESSSASPNTNSFKVFTKKSS